MSMIRFTIQQKADNPTPKCKLDSDDDFALTVCEHAVCQPDLDVELPSAWDLGVSLQIPVKLFLWVNAVEP